jgi:predicted metal-dependent enzyme (double-stranded beta helix superfamily)
MATAKEAFQEEYFIESDVLRAFIHEIKGIISGSESPAETVKKMRTPFARLLADREWLPMKYRLPAEKSGMGGGIGTWLIFRSADRSLSLTSLVVVPGAVTPVHDHLAWGLVGLYEGEQEERVYRQVRSTSQDHCELELVTVHQLKVGDFYDLLPPENDIHSVKTTSQVASVSLHLLGRDIGCVWRHSYDPEHSTVRPFRSGYSNAPCEDEIARQQSAGNKRQE